MSTRANIIIKDSYTKLFFYRHSDGYPEGTMPELNKFLDMVKSGKIRDNAQQSAGWLIMLGAVEYDHHGYSMEEISAGISGEPRNSLLKEYVISPHCWKVGAFEPTTGIHGDIEFLYVVDLEAKEINTYTDNFDVVAASA